MSNPILAGLQDHGDANVLSTIEINPFCLAISAIAPKSQIFRVGFVIVSV